MHKYQTTMFDILLFALGATSACIVATVNKHAVDYTRELLGLKKARDTKYKTSKKKGLHKTIAKPAPSPAAAIKAKGKKLSAAAASKAKGKKLSAHNSAPSLAAASKPKGKKPAKPEKASNLNTKLAEGLVSSPHKLVEEREVSEAKIEGSASNEECHYKIVTFVMPQQDEDVVGATKGEGKVMFVLEKTGRRIRLMGIMDGPEGKMNVLDKHVIPKQSCTWIVQMDEAPVTDAKSKTQGQELIYMDVSSLLASADNKTSHGYVVQGEMVDIVKKCVEKVRQMHADNRK